MDDRPSPLRSLLRQLPVLTAAPAEWVDPDALPRDPLSAVAAWLLDAVASGEPEPHAMTLSTVSAAREPTSRVLLCKDLDEQALYFATSSLSRKARDIGETGVASAHFYWKALARQARVTGSVVRLPAAAAAADFAARSRDSQLAALLHADGAPATPAQVRQARERLATRHPGEVPVPAHWAVYALHPHEVELWQGRTDRLHFRALYRRAPAAWVRELLWP